VIMLVLYRVPAQAKALPPPSLSWWGSTRVLDTAKLPYGTPVRGVLCVWLPPLLKEKRVRDRINILRIFRDLALAFHKKGVVASPVSKSLAVIRKSNDSRLFAYGLYSIANSTS
jgi:hypothetical protein